MNTLIKIFLAIAGVSIILFLIIIFMLIVIAIEVNREIDKGGE